MQTALCRTTTKQGSNEGTSRKGATPGRQFSKKITVSRSSRRCPSTRSPRIRKRGKLSARGRETRTESIRGGVKELHLGFPLLRSASHFWNTEWWVTIREKRGRQVRYDVWGGTNGERWRPSASFDESDAASGAPLLLWAGERVRDRQSNTARRPHASPFLSASRNPTLVGQILGLAGDVLPSLFLSHSPLPPPPSPAPSFAFPREPLVPSQLARARRLSPAPFPLLLCPPSRAHFPPHLAGCSP